MPAALTITPASGAIIAKTTLARIDVTGEHNPNTDTPPSERRLYILADAPAGTDDLKSHQFAVSSDGKHSWYAPVFPIAGAWVLRLRLVADDSDVVTLNVTVS